MSFYSCSSDDDKEAIGEEREETREYHFTIEVARTEAKNVTIYLLDKDENTKQTINNLNLTTSTITSYTTKYPRIMILFMQGVSGHSFPSEYSENYSYKLNDNGTKIVLNGSVSYAR